MANLSQLERNYFARKVGVKTPQTPLHELKRIYFSAQLTNVTTQTPLKEMERRWQVKVVRDGAITPSNEKSSSNLWREMVLVVGGAPVSNMSGNKRLFYLLAP